MSAGLYRLGRWAAIHPWRVIAVWAFAAVAVIAAASAWGRPLEDSFDVPGVDSHRAVELLSAAESDQAGVTARVVVARRDDAALTDRVGDAAAIERLRGDLLALDGVVAVTDPIDDPSAISDDARVALLTVQYPVIESTSADDLDDLKRVVERYASDPVLQVEAGGELFFHFEQPENGLGELGGLVAAVVILLVAFGSVIAMGLPIGIALFGLALGTTSMGLVTYLIEIPSWAPQMGSMIGLGVGIDYALFLVTRHREFLGAGLGVPEAAGRANATAGQAVVFAGGTVVIAILGLAVAGVPAMTASGIATSVIVALMVAGSISLLPAFLGLSGESINRFGIHRRASAHSVGRVTDRWNRWGRHVSRHAWPYAIGATLALLAVAAPVFDLRLGFPDEGTMPMSRTERRAYDLVSDGFGRGANGPLLIAVDLGSRFDAAEPDGAEADAHADALAALGAAVASDPGIAGVAPPAVDVDAGVATLVAFPTSAPQDPATFATVERLRADVFPAALADSGLSAHVGGATATFGDVADRVAGRLALFVSAVVLLSFALLMVVFRSILVPLKAALLNLLSIGAAYGVMVMVFQWGWGRQLIGLEATVPIVSFIPMFMFAVLFGLSMDYEVFLLSRVREEYVATGDNDRAVIAGLAGTGRVITSAALIMIAVFVGFVFGSDPLVKMMGLGLATAILIDATVVRMVLVPATMTLLGHRNWWLPGWLDRRLPRIDIDGSGGPSVIGSDAASSEPTRVASPILSTADLPGVGAGDAVASDPVGAGAER